MDRNGREWTENEREWTEMDVNGPKWIKMDQNRYRLKKHSCLP